MKKIKYTLQNNTTDFTASPDLGVRTTEMQKKRQNKTSFSFLNSEQTTAFFLCL
jgi:hypothetical protein